MAIDGSRCPECSRAFAGYRKEQGATGHRGSSSSWRKIRGLALKRDGYRCTNCGRTNLDVQQLGLHLEVDHIDGDPFNNALSNLRTLCAGSRLACHQRRHS